MKRKRGRPRKGTVSVRGASTETAKADICRRVIFAHTPSEHVETDEVSGFNSEAKVAEELTIPSVPTFCGKSNLEDIRPLIKEWLKSTEEPMHEDILIMV